MFVDIKDSWKQHFNRIMELESQFGGDAFDSESLVECLEDAQYTFGIISDDELAAYISIQEHDEGLYLWQVITDSKHRGKGYAKTLLNHITKLNQSIHLYVRQDNINAIGLYKSCGFKIVGKQHGRYHDGCSGLIMKYTPH